MCVLHFAWADIAQDANIHDVYYLDDQCFWSKAENGTLSSLLLFLKKEMFYKFLKKLSDIVLI